MWDTRVNGMDFGGALFGNTAGELLGEAIGPVASFLAGTGIGRRLLGRSAGDAGSTYAGSSRPFKVAPYFSDYARTLTPTGRTQQGFLLYHEFQAKSPFSDLKARAKAGLDFHLLSDIPHRAEHGCVALCVSNVVPRGSVLRDPLIAIYRLGITTETGVHIRDAVPVLQRSNIQAEFRENANISSIRRTINENGVVIAGLIKPKEEVEHAVVVDGFATIDYGLPGMRNEPSIRIRDANAQFVYYAPVTEFLEYFDGNIVVIPRTPGG